MIMKKFRIAFLICAASLAAVHTGCVQNLSQSVQLPSSYPVAEVLSTSEPSEGQNRAPVIQALTANPTQVVKAGDKITLNVKVFDGDGDTLDYTWTTTLGLLSATKGSLISWSPIKIDGTAEAQGVSVISLLVTDNRGGQDKADVNIVIKADGSAVIKDGLINPPRPSSEPSSSATPTVTKPLDPTSTTSPTYQAQSKLLYTCRGGSAPHYQVNDLYALSLETGLSLPLQQGGWVNTIDVKGSRAVLNDLSSLLFANIEQGQIMNTTSHEVILQSSPYSGNSLNPPEKLHVTDQRFMDDGTLIIMGRVYSAGESKELWSYQPQTKALKLLTNISTYHDGESFALQGQQLIYTYRDASTGTAIAGVTPSGKVTVFQPGQRDQSYGPPQFISASEVLLMSGDGIYRLNTTNGQMGLWMSRTALETAMPGITTSEKLFISVHPSRTFLLVSKVNQINNNFHPYADQRIDFFKLDINSQRLTSLPFAQTCKVFKPLEIEGF